MAPIITNGVSGDTLILMGDKITYKQIKNLIIGDIISTVNDKSTLEITPQTVTSIDYGMPIILYEITSMYDRIKISSETEMVLDRTGNFDPISRTAYNISKYSLTYTYDYNNAKMVMSLITNIKLIESEMIYNITTTGNNTCIAGNFIIN